MKIAYFLRGYDRTTEFEAVEHPVPERLLPMVRTLIRPVPDDHALCLPYELSVEAVRTLAGYLGLTLDPAAYYYYFEANDVSVETPVSNAVPAAN